MGTPHVVADRVLVQTTTTGTGTYQLGPALTGYLTPALAGLSSGARVCYTVVDNLLSPTQFEVVEGVYTSGSPATLTRGRIVRTHTGAQSAINWPSGTRYLFLSPNADRIPLLDTDGLLPQSAIPQSLFSQLLSSSTFAVPNGATSAVPWNSKGIDTLGAQPATLPVFALTAPSTGLYRANLCLSFGNSPTGERVVEIQVNGIARSRQWAATVNGAMDLCCSWEGQVGAGQGVQAFIGQSSGGTLACGGTAQSNFTLSRL